jgi:transketolase
MRIGIATDHGGFGLKEELVAQLRAAGHEVVDFGAHTLTPDDDYPDFVVPLARAVVARKVDRGLAICGSGVGASVCANKVEGARACLIHDHLLSSVKPSGTCDAWTKWLPWRQERNRKPKESTMSADKTAQLSINTIRALAIDAIQKANSGHPGTPLDAAPTAFTLWQQVLRYDPDHPNWLNRDRFVLSGGHASMLLYALIHLAGIKAANPSYEKLGREAVSLDDIRNFRQAGSRCPGHPEYGWTSGVTDPNDFEMLERAYRWFLTTDHRPTLIVVHSHIGYGAPHKQDSPSAHGEHDSISVGEDGPTHQPIEQLISLRAIPGMVVIRPADANEVVEAYRLIFSLKNRPAALICSRQALPIFDRSRFAPASGLAKGGYVSAMLPTASRM